MEGDYQYQVDYAKSSRARCARCRTEIARNSIRIAGFVRTSKFDGKIPRWVHFDCFFKKNAKIKSTSELKHFDSLRWEDQEKIRKAIDGATVESICGRKLYIKLSLTQINCFKCTKEISKERYMIVDGNVRSGMCYHLSCFLQSDLFTSDITTLAGFNNMKKVDQEAILLAENEANKPKRETRKRQPTNQDNDVPPVKKANVIAEAKSDEVVLKTQSRELWMVRDELKREVSKDAMIKLLEYNKQYVPTGLFNLLEALSDAMIFGALPNCPSCQNGPLRYTNGQYKCSGMATKWAPCFYHTRDPARVPFDVPKEYHDVELLRNYTYVERKRLFGPDHDATGKYKKALSDYTVFVTAGPHRDGKTKQQLLDEVKELGASVASKLKSGVLIVSGRDVWETALGRLKSCAEQLKLRVVSDELIRALVGKATPTESKLAKLLEKYTVSPWPVTTPVENSRENRTRQPTIAEKEGVIRVRLRGRASVEAECLLRHNVSVMRDSQDIEMTAVLGMVDLVKGTNSFYRLQALQGVKGDYCWVYRAWGRIGTTIGGTKVDRFITDSEARQKFERLYLEKTGNEWRNRANFEKKPHRFYEADLDYGDTNDQTEQMLPSKLHLALQALMDFICDIKSMRETMLEFELDLKKMPLGKLSKRQIQEAYTVLANLSEQLDQAARSNVAVDRTVLIGYSTQFYTLIPHNSGMKTLPLLDNRKSIEEKLQMLEDLCKIEVAYNLLRNSVIGQENLADQHYRQLNTELRPMDPDCEEYARIQDYVRLTLDSTRTRFGLQVEAVFHVERADEKARFDQFSAAQHNKQLLWHGSRLTNWVGILSQGLQIAPREAPASGYAFGKGIYFADLVSKSVHYCFVSYWQSDALLLLCEVILGDMDLSLTANSTPLPPGKHSRKGVGTLTPDPSTHYINPEGVLYPIGKPIDVDVDGSKLVYNEYVVYDVAQVKQKYLVRVKLLYN